MKRADLLDRPFSFTGNPSTGHLFLEISGCSKEIEYLPAPFNPTPDPSPKGRGDATPPVVLPSPLGRGDATPPVVLPSPLGQVQSVLKIVKLFPARASKSSLTLLAKIRVALAMELNPLIRKRLMATDLKIDRFSAAEPKAIRERSSF